MILNDCFFTYELRLMYLLDINGTLYEISVQGNTVESLKFELVHPSLNSFLVASLTNLHHRQKLVITDQRLYKSTSKRLSKKKKNSIKNNKN